MLFCLPGTHPWDYLYHFAANFGGMIILYLALTRVLRSSPRVVLLISIFFLCATGAGKEIEDIHLGGSRDTWKDISFNILGIVLSTTVLLASRFGKPTFTRHLY